MEPVSRGLTKNAGIVPDLSDIAVALEAAAYGATKSGGLLFEATEC